MKVELRYTAVVTVEVPDRVGLTAEQLREVADQTTNDYTDGRAPLSTEMMLHAAQQAAESDVQRAVGDAYWRRVERMFGNPNLHYVARGALIDRAMAQVTAWTKSYLDIQVVQQSACETEPPRQPPTFPEMQDNI